MLMIRCTALFSNHNSYLLAKKKYKRSTITSSNQKNVPQESKSQRLHFPFKLSTTLVAQFTIAVFALGFIDAGYSGDWSRIGVISKENEDLLKAAAFLVVPLCIFLIFSFIKKSDD